MSAQNVWDCICAYNRSTAKEIEKLYDNKLAEILATLNRRTGAINDAYYGHVSGTDGDNENPAGATNRAIAVAYLRKFAPERDSEGKKAPKFDSEKKAASIKKTADLVKIISENDNLGTAQKLLDAANPEWRDIKNVKQAYEGKKKLKKAERKRK